MKSLLHLLALLLICGIVNAQLPELVNELYSGEESSIELAEFQYVKYKDAFIFPVVTSDGGKEPGILKDGKLTVIKDVFEGPESSKPINFKVFEGLVYFMALDSIDRFALWSTDGNEENTLKVASLENFNPSHRRSTGMLVSNSGWLYYTHQGELFRLKEGEIQLVHTAANFYSNDWNSPYYTTYKEEIAYTSLTSNESVELFTIEGDSAVSLAKVNLRPGFTSPFGLQEINKGLLFGLDDLYSSNSAEGTYFYNAETDSLNKILINGSSASRLVPFTNEKGLVHIKGQGYYTVTGIEGEEIHFLPSTKVNYALNTELKHAVFEDRLLLYNEDDNSNFDHNYSYSDGTVDGTSELLKSRSLASRNILIENRYVYFVRYTERDEPYDFVYQYIDMSEGTIHKLNEHDRLEGERFFPNIFLIGVQNERLYIAGDFNSDLGTELYSIDAANISTSIEEIAKPDWTINHTHSIFELVTNGLVKAQANFYTIDGRLISSETIQSNQQYQIPDLNLQACILNIQFGGQSKSIKLITGRP